MLEQERKLMEKRGFKEGKKFKIKIEGEENSVSIGKGYDSPIEKNLDKVYQANKKKN